MSLTKIENEKLVDTISGKEIKDPYGPPLKDSKKMNLNQKKTKQKIL